ncbi:MAG: pentapeptide repeat-containing protein, partial [Actinobacteria bacterium]|nr:pentapeptide repeat-containing protein [Actinomycetota bacterium]
MSVQFKSFKNSANFKQLFTLALAAITFLSSTGTSASAGENSCDPNQSAILVECDFSGADLSGRSFVGYVIANSKFNGATITNSDFTGVNLSGNDFSSLVSDNGPSNTNLSGSNFTNSNLGGANFTNAVMNNINISGADLTGAILDGVASNSVNGSPLALPEKWHLMRGYLVGPKASLVGANLSDLDLRYWDFSGANLTGAQLYRSVFIGASFVGAKLNNANMDRSQAQ